jgi:hypothetical protein
MLSPPAVVGSVIPDDRPPQPHVGVAGGDPAAAGTLVEPDHAAGERRGAEVGDAAAEASGDIARERRPEDAGYAGVAAAATSRIRKFVTDVRLITVLYPPERVISPVMTGRPSLAVAGVVMLSLHFALRRMAAEVKPLAALMAVTRAFVLHGTRNVGGSPPIACAYTTNGAANAAPARRKEVRSYWRHAFRFAVPAYRCRRFRPTSHAPRTTALRRAPSHSMRNPLAIAPTDWAP